MRVTRSFALAVVTGAIVFGSAGLAGADHDTGSQPADPPGGVLVPGGDPDSGSGGNGPGEVGNGPGGGGPADDGPGDGGNGDGGDGPGEGADGDGRDERRGGGNDRRPCNDDRRSRAELAVDPGYPGAEGVARGDPPTWSLGDGGVGGPPGWIGHRSHCEDPPQAPTNPGRPPRSEPDVHADPEHGDTRSGSEAAPTDSPGPQAADEPGGPRPEPTPDPATESTVHPSDGRPASHGSSAPAPAPSLQRAEAGTGDGDDDGAAAGSASDDGGLGFGGGLLLIGGGGLLAAAAAAILAARTRRT